VHDTAVVDVVYDELPLVLPPPLDRRAVVCAKALNLKVINLPPAIGKRFLTDAG
jgi:hypothetical protein